MVTFLSALEIWQDVVIGVVSALVLFAIGAGIGFAVTRKAAKKAKAPAETPEEQPAPVTDEQAEAEPAPVVEEQTEEQPAPVVEEQPEEPAPVAEEEPEEPAPVAEEQPEEEPAPVADIVADAAVAAGNAPLFEVDYLKSHTARLILSDDTLKTYYAELKTELLSYKGVHARMAWRHETFRKGRALVARLCIRGKTLHLYLPLSAAAFADTKYKVEDVGGLAVNEDFPCLYRIKNDRRLKYAKELIAKVLEPLDPRRIEIAPLDYVKEFPPEPIEALLARDLVRPVEHKKPAAPAPAPVPAPAPAQKVVPEVRKEVKASEVSTLLADEAAETLVEESVRVADKSRVAVVNVDTLSSLFADGETVTLGELKARCPSIGKKTTYIKVLARGTIDKALTVEADDFSIDAVKMIVLTGGKVIRTKRA